MNIFCHKHFLPSSQSGDLWYLLHLHKTWGKRNLTLASQADWAEAFPASARQSWEAEFARPASKAKLGKLPML